MMTLGPNPTNINPQASPWGYAFQASSSVPSIQEQQQSRSTIADDILNMSVDEILSFYKHDTGLLKHILAVKAQDDQRKTAEELRQLDEARQKFGYDEGLNMVDYKDLTYTSEANKDSMTINNVSSVYSNVNNASPIFSESSFQTSQHYDPQDISAHFDLLLSPPPPATMMMDHGMNFFPVTSHSPQEQVSSVAISMDLPLMPSGTTTTQNFNFDRPVSSSALSPSFVTTGQFMSPSSHADYAIPDVFSTVSSSSSSVCSNSLVADLSTTMRPVSCSPSMETIRDSNSAHAAPATEIKKKPSSGKHKRRHLSTTSLPGFSSSTHVIRWAATKKKRISKPIVNINQEPQQPLDHKKVMEALRNKLTRTQPSSPTLDATTTPSSSPPAKTTPPTSPRSPPVDTQPSTSVLYLDLKSNPSPRHRNHRHQ